MFRRIFRKGIEDVRTGNDPVGFYFGQSDVPPNFANDRVVAESEIANQPLDPAGLKAYATAVAHDYKTTPPMKYLA